MKDSVWTPMPGSTPSALAGRAIERCQALAAMSEQADGITRTFLSPPMHEVHRSLGSCMNALGMRTRVDAAGNLRGIYQGAPLTKGRLLIASHLDTVPNAGAYDGILGVVLGLTLVEALDGRRLPFDIEIIGFSEEEGVRFGVPFLGSRALVGTLRPQDLATQDRNGISVRQAITDFGLNSEELPLAVHSHTRPPVLGYLEIHIEQGPVLESLDMPLAVVEAIVGQSRLTFRFQGQANHAGTTPMALRRDALAGAAEWVTEVERTGQSTLGLVCTVGRLQVAPGAGNVVPATVEASLDVRHADDAVRHRTVAALTRAAEAIAQRRGLTIEIHPLLDQPAVPCDPHLTYLLRRAIATAGYPAHQMPSGAGHDAMVVAAHFPMTMLFLRTPAGISHHPAETVLAGDVAAAIETGLQFLTELAKEF